MAVPIEAYPEVGKAFESYDLPDGVQHMFMDLDDEEAGMLVRTVSPGDLVTQFAVDLDENLQETGVGYVSIFDGEVSAVGCYQDHKLQSVHMSFTNARQLGRYFDGELATPPTSDIVTVDVREEIGFGAFTSGALYESDRFAIEAVPDLHIDRIQLIRIPREDMGLDTAVIDLPGSIEGVSNRLMWLPEGNFGDDDGIGTGKTESETSTISTVMISLEYPTAISVFSADRI